MCRVYGGKTVAKYVRLCWMFGEQQGRHIYFSGEPPLNSAGHYKFKIRSPEPTPPNSAPRVPLEWTE